MHPNPTFRATPNARNTQFARERAFGTLCINGDEAPLTSHIPFLLNEDATQVELHLVRSNPIVPKIKAPVPAVITCLGPDGYVSPDWYGIDDQVPTWNYISVRITGKLVLQPQEDLHAMLDQLSAHFEGTLDKAPWTSEKMSDGVMERMMRMIVPCKMIVDSIEGTWKLNQNKDDAVRHSAAEHIATGHGTDLLALAELMRTAK